MFALGGFLVIVWVLFSLYKKLNLHKNENNSSFFILHSSFFSYLCAAKEIKASPRPLSEERGEKRNY